MYVLFFSLRGCDSDELYEAVPSVISVWGVASSPFMLLGEPIAYALVMFLTCPMNAGERSLIISVVMLLLGSSIISRDEVAGIRCASQYFSEDTCLL